MSLCEFHLDHTTDPIPRNGELKDGGSDNGVVIALGANTNGVVTTTTTMEISVVGSETWILASLPF
jgi:hypothetical protein